MIVDAHDFHQTEFCFISYEKRKKNKKTLNFVSKSYPGKLTNDFIIYGVYDINEK